MPPPSTPGLSTLPLCSTYLCSSSLGCGYCDLQRRRAGGEGGGLPSGATERDLTWAYLATGWNGLSPLYCSFMLLVGRGEKEPLLLAGGRVKLRFTQHPPGQTTLGSMRTP